MPREVNVFIGNWTATGVNVSTPQYSVDVTINWTRNDGTQDTKSATVKFPNVLAQLPAAWVKQEMEELLLRAARKLAGVDET